MLSMRWKTAACKELQILHCTEFGTEVKRCVFVWISSVVSTKQCIVLIMHVLIYKNVVTKKPEKQKCMISRKA